MNLLLTLEVAPRPQVVREKRLKLGDILVIGRSADAGWCIDDPDMYVSGKHCTVQASTSGFIVTDTSSNGLYLDEAHSPLGRGNSVRLQNGMRLRLGDYVVRVEIPGTAPQTAASRAQLYNAEPQPSDGAGFDADDFFSAPKDTPKPEPRPADLPDPFDQPISSQQIEKARACPPLNDPFTLDPAPTPLPEPSSVGNFDWKISAPEPANSERSAVPPEPQHQPPAGSGSKERDAFLRGLGVDPAAYASVDMEALGHAHRQMLEGLMHLLRKRQEEKAAARLDQTIVSGSEVNPLKFMPTIDDVLDILISRRSSAFLDEEAAITGAIRDLAQHHIATWRGLQGALIRLPDRFDPAALEDDLKVHSRVGTLLAGGRRAKLWELYEERYREIARSAERDFLGEIGSDFRDFYEKKSE